MGWAHYESLGAEPGPKLCSPPNAWLEWVRWRELVKVWLHSFTGWFLENHNLWKFPVFDVPGRSDRDPACSHESAGTSELLQCVMYFSES